MRACYHYTKRQYIPRRGPQGIEPCASLILKVFHKNANQTIQRTTMRGRFVVLSHWLGVSDLGRSAKLRLVRLEVEGGAVIVAVAHDVFGRA